MKYIFMFDIDETLLSCRDGAMWSRLNDVPYDECSFHPYRSRACIALNKKKMSRIFKEILENGHTIGFITKSTLHRERIKSFVQIEYKIHLEDFMHYNRINNKTAVLKQIADNCLLPYQNIFLIDNDASNIIHASNHGFSTIYADNNLSDRTNGTEYIKKLRSIVKTFSKNDKNKIIQQRRKCAASWFFGFFSCGSKRQTSLSSGNRPGQPDESSLNRSSPARPQ